MNEEIYTKATDVSVKDGVVHLDGPDGVDVSMTPDAAVETSDRLHEAGVQAHGEQVEKKRVEDERRARRP